MKVCIIFAAEAVNVQVKEHASKAEPRVKQAKILRDPERIEPADGLPRSRGLGFVEFTQHDHAICALRQLNNNPAPFSKTYSCTDKPSSYCFCYYNLACCCLSFLQASWPTRVSSLLQHLQVYEMLVAHAGWPC